MRFICIYKKYSYLYIIKQKQTDMKIKITLATGNIQEAIINGLTYQFDFTTSDLAASIEKYSSVSTLSEASGLDSDDYTATEMAMEVSNDWSYADVQIMIQDYITENPENLADHLITE